MKKLLRQLIDNELNASYVALMIALIIGRALGLVREIVMVNLYGSTRTTDLMIVALTFPDVITNLLAGSGLIAVLTPLLSRSLEPARARILKAALAAVGCAFGGAALALWLASDQIFSWLALGLLPFGAVELKALSLAFLCIPLAGLSGVLVAALVAQGRFVYGGLGTALFNICVIAGLVAGSLLSDALFLFCSMLVVGALARLGLHLWASRAEIRKLKYTSADFAAFPARSIIISACGMAGLTVVPIGLRAFASGIEPGALTQLTLAIKLIEIPLTVVFWSIGISALPKLAQLYRDNPEKATRIAGNRLVFSAIIGVVCSILVLVASPYLLLLGFSDGMLTPRELTHVQNALNTGALFLPMMSFCTVLLNDSFARRDFCSASFIIAFSVLIAFGVLPHDSLVALMTIWGVIYGLTALLLLTRRILSIAPQLPALKALLFVTGYWLLGASGAWRDFGLSGYLQVGSIIGILTLSIIWGLQKYAISKNAV